MGNILLKKGEYYFLEDKFFIVKRGKVIARDVFPSGKVVAHEHYLVEGELVGNFFNFIGEKKLKLPNVEMEIEALRDSELEEFNFSKNILYGNIIFEKIIKHLIKKSTIKFLKHAYEPKGYMLSILKLYADDKFEVGKEEISYEILNMSKSQYYLKLGELKRERYIEDKEKCWRLNLEKINEFLEKI